MAMRNRQPRTTTSMKARNASIIQCWMVIVPSTVVLLSPAQVPCKGRDNVLGMTRNTLGHMPGQPHYNTHGNAGQSVWRSRV